jgi:ligand-binding sensor domain-containing protein
MKRFSQLRRFVKPAVQFLAGFGGIVLIGFLILQLIPKAKERAGWQTIRPPQDVMALALYQDHLWSGGRDGLIAVDLQTGNNLPDVVPENKFKGITALLVTTKNRTLWVAHRQGVSRLQGNQWKTFGRVDGLPENQVLCLAEDPDGSIWAGTLHGAALYKNGSWLTFTSADGLANDTVSLIYIDSRDRVWFANGFTPAGGLTIWDGSDWLNLSANGKLPHASVNAIYEDSNGTIWLGTGFASLGGLASYDGENWITMDQSDGLAGAKVRYLFKDMADNFWVGSEYDGIAVLGKTGNQILTPKNGLAGWEVKAMLQTGDGSLWLGTENGLTYIDGDTWKKEFSGTQ